jgi:Co/Zn/Cd efflux system component
MPGFKPVFRVMQFVNVLALFGLYIFWTGAERILTPAASKKIPLLVATFITFVGIFVASNFLLTKLINKIYYAFFS